MKVSLRLGWVVAALATAWVALVALAVHGLVVLGFTLLAVAVAVLGLAALVGVAVAWAQALRATAQVPQPAPRQPAVASLPPARRGFKLREAKPGEIPAPYLAAVMKGAQATRAAQKAQQAGSPEAGASRH